MEYPWSYDELTQTTTIHPNFNEKLTGLPPSTIRIIFQDFDNDNWSISSFDQPIEQNQLPPNVQYIKFGYHFNQPVNEDNLPPNLTHLTFGAYFNQPIDGLPNSLISLTFGDYFNQSLDVLPENLTHLSIKSFLYDKELNNLPCNLKMLKIYKRYPIEKIKLPFGCKLITT